MRIPFACELCGAIDFKFKAVRDVVFLYPQPKVENIGVIILPDYDSREGNLRENMTAPVGYILTACSGDVDRNTLNFKDFSGQIEPGDKVYYNRNVPWEMELPAPDGSMHKVVYCGFMDLYAKVINE